MLLGDIIINHDSKRVPLSSKQREQLDKIYPYYGAQGIIDFVDNYLFDGEYMLIAEDGENLRSRKQPIAFIVNGKFWVNNHAHIVTSNENSDLYFIYYWLNFNDISEYITGSAQPKLSQGKLNIIPLPDLTKAQQKVIGITLKTYDTKINKNNEHIKILELSLQTLYQSWFNDFKYPDTTGELRKSEELQKYIPQEWKGMKFGQFLTPYTEKIGDINAPVYSATNNGIALRDEKFNKDLSKSYSNNKKIVKDDLIFGLSREILNFGVVTAEIGSVSPAYQIFKINKVVFLPFLLELEMRINMTNYMDILQLGAREGQSISKDLLLNKYILVPDMKVQQQFEVVYRAIKNKIDKLKEENTLLAEIRDALLPKLMSGELHVEAGEE